MAPARPGAGRPLLLAAALALLALSGCAGGPTLRPMREVAFRAPAKPDLQMRLILEDVDTLGVLSGANVAPLQGIDIQKVMGRLADATVTSLRHLEDRTVIAQDEIRWHFREMTLDSATVFDRDLWPRLRAEMGIDAVVFLTLRELRAQMTGASPTPYGMAPTPGMNFAIDLEIALLNLESGDIWRHQCRATSWQPTQSQVVGSADRSEQQLLAALGRPLRQFLARLAPPPQPQRRTLDLSGD